MLPGVAVTSGSETAMPVNVCDIETGATCWTLAVAGTCSFEKIGAILLCKPKNSVAESIKAKCEPPAPRVVIAVSRANRIAKIAKPLTREKRKDLGLRNIVE